ncbi:hypothetical protein SEA_COLT_188 [Mycobacterium phage Colt]|uniref:Uncharacterized protein n=1 Tax=Mycobacterium phage Cane17 TaxID=2301548 RepID=A0A346N8Y5_9CAUD|nr:hypothetical protein KHO59_gp138 [Mycobacterium phage Cane17]AXQ51770.1 hypothetical protein SEA_CANE17_188 [Mycobacterium phage Cane17]QAY14104.1 hypothetical protein SEA_COLT_188 [Mycobacterium phage Colt]
MTLTRDPRYERQRDYLEKVVRYHSRTTVQGACDACGQTAPCAILTEAKESLVLLSTPPFYWQREHLPYGITDGHQMPQRDLIEALMIAYGEPPGDVRRLGEEAEQIWRAQRVQKDGWTPREWVDLLQKLSYKPGWHCQILLGYPTPRIEIETVVTLPDGATERLASSAMLYENMPGARWAHRAISSMLQEMETVIMRTYLRRDGEPWTEEKDVP